MTCHHNGRKTVTNASLATRNTEIAVIGGGIVGLSCAYHLRRAGHDVLLIDPQGFGKETSFGNAGSISCGAILPQSTPGILREGLKMMFDREAPLKLDYGAWTNWATWVPRFVFHGARSRVIPIVDAMHAINTASRQAWFDMADAIDARELIAETGYLHVYSEASSFEDTAWERKLMDERAVSHQVLDAKQLHDLEPGLGDGFKHGLLQDTSLALSDPGQFCQRLGDAAVADGVEYLRAKVAQIRPEKGGNYRVITDHGTVQAKRIVLAAGVWTNGLLRDLRVKLRVIPARGYHLMYPHQQGVVTRPTLWAERYMVLTPMVPGIRMTSIKELTRVGREPHYGYIQRRDVDARWMFPGLSGDAVSEWYGYRPVTPDSLPIIDQLEGEEIYLATGHGHFGLTQGPVTGKLIAEMVAGNATTIPMGPYRRTRFG